MHFDQLTGREFSRLPAARWLLGRRGARRNTHGCGASECCCLPAPMTDYQTRVSALGIKAWRLLGLEYRHNIRVDIPLGPRAKLAFRRDCGRTWSLNKGRMSWLASSSLAVAAALQQAPPARWPIVLQPSSILSGARFVASLSPPGGQHNRLHHFR